ncbi:MAG: hypothetical protein H6739_08010 [Alphaproteobacteria bacterium]|nr:hypothetical protein [Alphaproteobacteria bacterium]
MLALFTLSAPALAGDAVAFEDDDGEEEFDFLKQGKEAAKNKEAAISADDFSSYDAEDEEFSDFKLAAPPPPADTDVEPVEIERGQARIGTSKATKLPYDIVGKDALADNYPAQVVHVDRDAVVVELPVLITREASAFDGVGYWLVTELYADGMKLTESRTQISRAAIAQSGPTLVFVKLLAPVPSPTGTLELRVGRATSGAGKPQSLFTRTVDYAVP